jgi:hypothetical protein
MVNVHGALFALNDSPKRPEKHFCVPEEQLTVRIGVQCACGFILPIKTVNSS